MGIVFTGDTNRIDREELERLYEGTADVYDLFRESFITVYALETGAAFPEVSKGNIKSSIKSGRLAGAVRVLSEGVETALLVDLKAAEGYGDDIKTALVREAENKLTGKRVMVYGSYEDLGLFEDLGYGRCKNAWTYFRNGMPESDFLPPGYRFENEYDPAGENKTPASGKPERKAPGRAFNAVYREGYGNTSFDEINRILTVAFGGRPHDVNRTEAAFKNSRHSITAYDGERLIGVARTVSDGHKYATILNVAVDPEYQGLSIGKNLVLKLSELARADVIVLNTHPGAAGFYNRISEYRRNRYVFEKFIRPEEPPAPVENGPDLNNRRAPGWANAMFTPKGYRFPDEYRSLQNAEHASDEAF